MKIDDNAKWLNENDFKPDIEIKNVWRKTYSSGFIVKVSYNKDEDLFYAKPVEPGWLDYILNLLSFEAVAVTAEKAVSECISHYREVLKKAYDLSLTGEDDDE